MVVIFYFLPRNAALSVSDARPFGEPACSEGRRGERASVRVVDLRDADSARAASARTPGDAAEQRREGARQRGRRRRVN